jgi:hypothetical protein
MKFVKSILVVKTTKVNFLTKIWLKFGELVGDALKKLKEKSIGSNFFFCFFRLCRSGRHY